MKQYQHKNARRPIIATMADESRLRKQAWIKNGCNSFNSKDAKSNPMSFWVENDVLEYIRAKSLPICSIYGDIVEDYAKQGLCDGQCRMFEESVPLKTTGVSRQGCEACLFGAHLEKGKGRFELLRELHPKRYEWILRPVKDGGLGYADVIDWLNREGGLHIRY